jgi:hypothetical protein
MKVFVSYSGQNATSPYFARFCALLDEALVDCTGDKSGVHVLWDAQLRQGDQWPARLAGQLNEADALLLLYSPLYFTSVPCGRELGFFLDRLDPERPLVELPVVPVWWTSRREKSAEGFSLAPRSGDARLDELQNRSKRAARYGAYSFDDIERMGLDQFLINEAHVDFKPALTAYFHMLAERLCDLAPTSGKLRTNPGAFDAAPDAWARARSDAVVVAAPAAGPAPAAPTGARVHFVVLAARPEEIEKALGAGGPQIDAYREEGGKDWRPFWPADGYVGYWLQRIVQRNFDGCEANVIVASEPALALEMAQKIDRLSQPLFFIVDAWTSHIEPHSRLVKELSMRNLPNCAVIVPFIGSAEHPDVVDRVHDLLQQREELEDVLCKTYVAASESELETHIATLHERMRQKFRSRAARDNRRKLSPFAGGARPDLGAVGEVPGAVSASASAP